MLFRSNTLSTLEAASYGVANASFNTANAAYAAANNITPQVAPSYNTANAAYNYANSINSFATINVSSQSNVVASISADVLKLATDGSLNITTSSKTITFALANTIDYGLVTGAVTSTNDYGSVA